MSHKLIKDGAILFLLALVLRASYAIFFVEIEYFFSEDQAGYIQLAQQFSENGFLETSLVRVSGYPFFISSIYTIFGESLWNVISVQILLDSISCIVIALMAKLIFGKGFWVAGILSAINLNMIILSSSLLTDSLFLFLFTIFLFSLLKYLNNDKVVWFFLLVLFISLATLVRPVSYYLLPFLLIGLVGLRLWNRDSFFKVSALIVIYSTVVIVLLGSVHQYNYQKYNTMRFASHTGATLLKWVVPAAYQYSGQGDYQEGLQLSDKKLAFALKRDQLDSLPLNPYDSSDYQASIAKEILFEFGFFNILKAWVAGSVMNLVAPSVAFAPALRAMDHSSFYETKGDGMVEKLFNYIKNSSGILYVLILVIGTIISTLFILLATIGMVKMFLQFPPVTVITLIALVGYFLVVTGPIIGVKYRLPIEPLLTLFASYSVLIFLQKNIHVKHYSKN
jgi:4-amino-4-deoxy-L-arabinose transferase-like glycosyltransferase